MGGLTALRGMARIVSRITKSARARGFYLRVDAWTEREQALELSVEHWDLSRREAAVQRNADREERRRRRRL
jgi:hypothetical protein